MNKLISFSEIHPIKKALASLKIITRDRYNHYKKISNISRNEALRDQQEVNNQYSDNFSYAFKLFDCTSPSSLHLFHPYSDRDIGGDSLTSLDFNTEEKCLQLTGNIEAKNKDKLQQYPSIGLARRHPYRIKCGPFHALQVQIYSDGMPIHIGIQLQSKVQGLVKCYGILTNRIKGWGHYELPFQNMLVVGAEDGDRGTKDYQISRQSQQIFDREAYDAYRILYSEIDQPIIRDLNIRLLETRSVHRKLGLRNIFLVRRGHSTKFLQQYRQPYFYKVQADPYVVNQELGISWLRKGFKEFSVINLGDKIYKRKNMHTAN